MELLRGRPVADRIDAQLRSLSEISGSPRLAVYLAGADESSLIYSRSKVRKGERIGARVVLREFAGDVAAREVKASLMSDASDPDVHGIMIERPLPDGIDIQDLMALVPTIKDVEGLHPENYGLLGMGRPRFIAPTPLGALLLMLHYDILPQGKEIVVAGRSPNVGRPLATLLSQKKPWGNSTVTLVHSRTANIASHTRRADVILTAVGKAGFITGDMIKEGAVLVDLGINPVKNGIVGDVDLDSVEGVASAATPTPGGTGPVTVSSMFLNLYLAMVRQEEGQVVLTDGIIDSIYGSTEGS
ncbi:MAG: bifunctional 5,10-methylenetetrahydrofolate dehydrogenase/5,10-methenyltetrahydrofolate cyclohydrolase [Thermoplasmatota archaeon]